MQGDLSGLSPEIQERVRKANAQQKKNERLECLRLAVGACQGTEKNPVDATKEFFDFITGK